jgi:hypothetical protein
LAHATPRDNRYNLPVVRTSVLDSDHSADDPLAQAIMSENRLPKNERVTAALLGLAFDAEDGHSRITRGKNFLLAGGSEETHGIMRETILRVNERLNERGLRLADVTAEELRDLLNESRP